MDVLVVVGASLGGVEALQALLGGLPETFLAPLAIVQHRGDPDDDLLRTALESASNRPVREVADKEPIARGITFLAPAGYHLLVDGRRFALSIDPPESSARPSIDVLFESAARAYGRGAVAVILSGTGEDGARGASAIRRVGGSVLVQDPATAQACQMPEAALSPGTDHVGPVHELARILARECSARAGDAA